MIKRRLFLQLVAAVPVLGCQRRDASPLAALADAVLPAGHGLPGAVEAGVPEYLARALAEPRFAGVRRLLVDGAAALEARHGRLADLPAAARLEALAGAPPQFVAALIDFTIEGYLGHPDRGGNRGGRVWSALRIPIPA